MCSVRPSLCKLHNVVVRVCRCACGSVCVLMFCMSTVCVRVKENVCVTVSVYVCMFVSKWDVFCLPGAFPVEHFFPKCIAHQS